MSESPDEAPAVEGVSTETTDTGKPIASLVPLERPLWQQLLLWFGPWFVVAVAAWMWWSTFTSTSAARIASLQTIEPYAFAVQEQLLHNFNENGSFFQTIHKGYDDDWTWSGHRAITLVINGYLYGLAPDSFGLARLQGFWMLLGCIPAALIGRRVMGSRWGISVGGFVYLAAPPVMALALQDYQDLVFATPALVFAFWAMRAQHPLWALVGASIAVMPREECVPMALVVSLIAIPWSKSPKWTKWKGWVQWKRWAWNVAITATVAGVYSWWSATYYPISDGHDMPLENAIAGLNGERLFLDGWPYWDRFYVWVFVPLGLFALLSPLALMASLGLIVLHMTVPAPDAMSVSHGVDRSWNGHAHHMAPIMGFLLVASVEGVCHMLRILKNPGMLERIRHRATWSVLHHPRIHLAWLGIPIAVTVGLALYSVNMYANWAGRSNMRVSWTHLEPEWVHPAWTLMEQVPEDAIPIVSRITSPVAANRTIAYTADESLLNKAPMQGLAAGTWMLVDTRQSNMLRRAQRKPDSEVVDSIGPFVLVSWTETGADPTLREWYKPGQQRPMDIKKAPDYLGPYSRKDDIPGVPAFESSQLSPEERGTIPTIPLPW